MAILMKKSLFGIIVTALLTAPVYAGGWGEKGIPPTGEVDLTGNGYYTSFDTSTVHYWAPSGLHYRDTVMLTLAYNNSCDYVHPFDGHVTSKFGKRRRRMHYGIDIDLETGDRVKCSFEGVVRFAMWNDSYGNLVIVRHPNGLETYYAHLSKIDVKPGQYVQAGEYIGLGGNTGHSFGDHLHFEVRFLGMPIDPTKLIDFTTGKLLYNNVHFFLKKDRLDMANAERYHQVTAGEDIYSIARLYHIDVAKLLEMNNLREDDLLLIDSQVRYY